MTCFNFSDHFLLVSVLEFFIQNFSKELTMVCKGYVDATLLVKISLKSTSNMATVKFFGLVQSFYQTLGLYPPESNQSLPSKLRFLFFSTFTLLIFISSLGFLLFEAKTIQVIFPSISLIFSLVFPLLHLIKCGFFMIRNIA